MNNINIARGELTRAFANRHKFGTPQNGRGHVRYKIRVYLDYLKAEGLYDYYRRMTTRKTPKS